MLRQPGWLSPAQPVDPEVARELQKLWPQCLFSSMRRWNSFVAASCDYDAGKSSVVQAYLTYNDGWKKLAELEGASLSLVRPFHCVSNVTLGFLDEMSPERMGDVQVTARQVEDFCGRKFSVFGIVSVGECGPDCAVAKVHVGDGVALFVRLFRASAMGWEILALRMGQVKDRLPLFECSRVS